MCGQKEDLCSSLCSRPSPPPTTLYPWHSANCREHHPLSGASKREVNTFALEIHHCLETPVRQKGKINGGGVVGGTPPTKQNKTKPEKEQPKSTKPRGDRESLILVSCSTWREMRAGPARSPRTWSDIPGEGGGAGPASFSRGFWGYLFYGTRGRQPGGWCGVAGSGSRLTHGFLSQGEVPFLGMPKANDACSAAP